MKTRFLFNLLFLFLAAEFPSAAQAGTQSEYKALRNYCFAVARWQSGGNRGAPPTKGNLTDVAQFSPYCATVLGMDKLYIPRNQAEKQTVLAKIESDMSFLISQLPGDHYLLPEVHAQLGKALYLANDYAAAETNLLKALSLDPGHAPVYVTLAELYRSTKRKDKAVEAVRAGLALSPEITSLRRIARELGITVNKTPPPAKTPAPKAMAETEVKATPPTPIEANAGRAKTEATPTPATEGALPPPADSGEIGRPGNPWCRFCPANEAAPAAPSPATPGVIPKDWQ